MLISLVGQPPPPGHCALVEANTSALGKIAINLAVNYSSSVRAPKLCEVLEGQSHAPWTLAAFKKFLAANYCSEVLDFTNAVTNYRTAFELKVFLGHPSELEENAAQTYQLWKDIMDMYIKPNAPREINIPGAVRSQLLAQGDPANPPSPDLLLTAYNLMFDLMGGIFVQFVESLHPEDTASTGEKAQCHTVVALAPEQAAAPELLLQDPEIPFYKRAHGLWGSSRVYRRIRKAPGDGKSSPTPDDSSSHSSHSQDHIIIFGKRWGSH